MYAEFYAYAFKNRLLLPGMPEKPCFNVFNMNMCPIPMISSVKTYLQTAHRTINRTTHILKHILSYTTKYYKTDFGFFSFFLSKTG